MLYTLAQIRNGTGFPRGALFAVVERPEHKTRTHGLCPVCGHYGADCTANAAEPIGETYTQNHVQMSRVEEFSPGLFLGFCNDGGAVGRRWSIFRKVPMPGGGFRGNAYIGGLSKINPWRVEAWSDDGHTARWRGRYKTEKAARAALIRRSLQIHGAKL